MLTPEEIDDLPDSEVFQGPPAPRQPDSLPLRVMKGAAQALGLVRNTDDEDANLASELRSIHKGPIEEAVQPVQEHLGKVSRFWEQTPMIRTASGALQDAYETVTGNPTLRNTRDAIMRDRGGKVLDYVQHGDTDIRTPYEKQMDAEGDVGAWRGVKDAVFSSPETVAKFALAAETGGASLGGQSLANALIFGVNKKGFSPNQALVMGGLPQFGKFIAKPVSESLVRSLADAGIVRSPAIADLAETALKTAIDTAYFEAPNTPELMEMSPRERARHLAGSIGTMIAFNAPELARNGIDFVNDARINRALENHLTQEDEQFANFASSFDISDINGEKRNVQGPTETGGNLTPFEVRPEVPIRPPASGPMGNMASALGIKQPNRSMSDENIDALNNDNQEQQPLPSGVGAQEEGQAQKPGQVPEQEAGGEPAPAGGILQAPRETVIPPDRTPTGPMSRGQMRATLGIRNPNISQLGVRTPRTLEVGAPIEPQAPGQMESIGDQSIRSRAARASGYGKPAPVSALENIRVKAHGFPEGWANRPLYPSANQIRKKLQERSRAPVKKKDEGIGNPLELATVAEAYNAADRLISTAGPRSRVGRVYTPASAITDTKSFRQVLAFKKPAAILDEPTASEDSKRNIAEEAQRRGLTAVKILSPSINKTYYIIGHKWAVDTLLNRYNRPRTVIDDVASGLALGYRPQDIAAFIVHGDKSTRGKVYTRQISNLDGTPYEYDQWRSNPVSLRPTGEKMPEPEPETPPRRLVSEMKGIGEQSVEYRARRASRLGRSEPMPVVAKQLSPAEIAAKESGWTMDPKATFPGVQMEGLTPAEIEALAKVMPKQYEFTDRRKGSLTEGLTTYVPESATTPEILNQIKAKADEYIAAKTKPKALSTIPEVKPEPPRFIPKKPMKVPEPEPPQVEEPSSDPRVDLANELIDDYELDPESTRAKGVKLARKLHAQQLIDDLSLQEIERIGKDKDMGPDDMVSEIRSSLITGSQEHGQLARTQVIPEPVVESSGLEGLRELVNNPESGLSEEHRKVIRSLLDTPALKGLFWDRMSFRLGDTGIPETTGSAEMSVDDAGRIAELAISMVREAGHDAFPHEVFHVLYALAPADVQAHVRRFRDQEIYNLMHSHPELRPTLEKLLQRDMTSEEFIESKLPHDIYHVINPSEYMAWFSGNRFSAHTLRPEVVGIRAKIHEWVTGIVDWFRNAFGFNKDQGMEEIYHGLLNGEYQNSPQGGINFEAGSLSKAIETFKESDNANTDPETKERSKAFLSKEQAGDVLGQIDLINQYASDIQAELVNKNTRGNIVLKGPELARYKTFEMISKMDPIKRFVLGSSEHLKESAALLNGAITKYQDIKSNQSNPPELVSAAAKAAMEQLDAFYESLPKFQRDREEAINKTLDDLNRALDETTKAGKGTALQTLRKSLAEVGTTFGDQTLARSILDKNSRAATYRALDWITKNVSNTNIKASKNADELFQAVDAEITSKVTDDKTWEMVVGTTAETVRRLSRMIAESPKLKADVLETQKVLTAPDTDTGVADAKKEIENLLKEEKYKEAIDVLNKGYGKDAAERESTRQFMAYHWKDVAKQLPKLEAFQRAGQMLGKILEDPQFRDTVHEVYSDAGVREVVRLPNETKYTLKPIYSTNDKGEKVEPTELNLSPGAYGAHETLSKLSNYFDEAERYINNPDHPEYDPRLAAGLKAFLSDKALWLDPSVNPLSHYFRKSTARKLIEKTVGFKWRAEMIPMYALDRQYGVAAEDANRSLQRLASAMEMRSTIAKEHLAVKGGIWDALYPALKSHGFSVEEINNYQDSVWSALVGSLQDYANLSQLKAGSKIGNGFEVTPEDITLLKAVRSFEKDAFDTSEGTGKRKLASIASDPESVLYKTEKGYMQRKHMDTGPGTMSRRYQAHVSAWDREWAGKTEAERIDFLNRNVNPVLFGYVLDAENGAYVGRYNYRPEFREILKEARDGQPIQSFDDLAQRTYEKRLENSEEGEEELPDDFSVEMVKKDILHELDDTFKRFRSTLPSQSVSMKSDIEFFGGDNAFNTERGQQVIPSMWYKYGSLTMGEAVSFLHQFSSKFMLEHYRAVSRLLTALDDLSMKYDKGLIKDSNDYFYNAGEVKAARKEVKDYLNKLTKVRQESNELQIPDEFGNFTNPIVNYHVSSMLSKPKTLIINMMNGVSNALSFEQAVLNHGPWAMAKGLFLKPVPAVAKEALHLLTHPSTFWGKEVREILSDARNKPVVGKIAESIFNYLNRSAEIYGKAADLGLNLNTNLLSTMHSESKFAGTGGYPVGGAPRGMLKKVLSQSAYPFRVASQAIRHAFQGYVDSRVNSMAVGMADNMEQDLMNRALKYGEARVARAEAQGRNPYDITDLRNRFSDAELVKGRLGAPDAASRLREFMRRYSNVNIDHQMWDFYRRRQTDPNAKLFTEEQKNQLILAVSQDINQSTFATRPVIQRTNKLFNALGLFLGYPAYEMHHLSSYLDKQANTSYGKAALQNLPLMLTAGATAALAGTMAIAGADLVHRKLFKSIPLYASIVDAKSNKDRLKAVLSGLASILPYYGWIINMALGRSYKYGLDANNLTVLLGYADQLQQVTREMFATRESWKDPHWAMPIMRMESRSTFPLNYAAPHLPVMSGKYEITQVGNAIGSHAKDIGLEERKGADGGFWPHHDKVILDKWDNAVGNGDMQEARAAFHELIMSNRANKVQDPEGAARRTLSARNPITRKLAKKPTEEEWNKILADMPDEDRQRVVGLLHNYNRALTLVGANEVAFKSAMDTGGGGGGGGSSSSDGAPAMGTVSTGGGGGSASLGGGGGISLPSGGGGGAVSRIGIGSLPSVKGGLRRVLGNWSATRGIRLRSRSTKRSGLRRLSSRTRRASLGKLRGVVAIKRGIV